MGLGLGLGLGSGLESRLRVRVRVRVSVLPARWAGGDGVGCIEPCGMRTSEGRRPPAWPVRT